MQHKKNKMMLNLLVDLQAVQAQGHLLGCRLRDRDRRPPLSNRVSVRLHRPLHRWVPVAPEDQLMEVRLDLLDHLVRLNLLLRHSRQDPISLRSPLPQLHPQR